jgi:transcription antitermination factor NusG
LSQLGVPQLGVELSGNTLPLVLDNMAGKDARWFAVYTNSRHEKCVARHFDQRQIESFLPLYQKLHHWTKHNNVRLALPLFPNYVFVHIAPPQRTSVLAVQGVLGMVGRGHIASALPDAEIESLRTGLQLRKFEPHPYLVAGERVRIKAGAMEGMEGILLRKKNELRVVLTLDLIERSVAVEVDAQDVEPVSSRPV